MNSFRLPVFGVWIFAAIAMASGSVTGQQTSEVKTRLATDQEILQFYCGDQWPEELNKYPELLAEVLRAGPLSDRARYAPSMANLAAIVAVDSQAVTEVQRQRTAVAVALEFSSDYIQRGPTEAAERYVWYRDAQIQRKLHPSFDRLQSWERRFVVNLPWHHGGGSNKDLDWLNANVKLPAIEYTGACWQAPYRDSNPFGESVQEPLYYVPFEEFLGPYQMRREVGAVCGGLSHYGAAAARANGIGALTMGEPGHCAYAVRVDGKWIPSYSLSQQRWAHQFIFDSPWAYIELQELALSDIESNLKAARLSGTAAILAERDPREAAQVAIQACRIQPQNPLLWKQRLQLLQAGHLDQPGAWWEQARQLGKALAGFPSVVVDLVHSLEQKAPVLDDPQQRGRIMAAALENSMGADAPLAPATDWKETFNKTYQFCGDERALQIRVCQAAAEEILKGREGQHFLEDALERFSEQSDLISQLMVAAEKGLRSQASGSKETEVGKARSQLAQTLVRSAAERRDCEAFQKFSKFLTEPVSANLKGVKNPFGGQLLSTKGSIRFSSTSSWDQPAGHASVLAISGGKFHTGNGEHEWAEITLPRIAKLSGIIIDNEEGHRDRAVPLKVEVSPDGEHWETVFLTDKAELQWQIDLRAQQPVARFVRVVGSEGRNDFLHLRRILVFGKPQA